MSNKIFVTRSSLPPFEEYTAEIKDLWESRMLTNSGVKHEALRQKLCEYLEVEGIELFTNGHQALELSLQALGITGEVITTPFTFASTTQAIVRQGATPVFCDIREDDFTIDADQIEALITEKTEAILPVHVYGNVCDTEKIQAIADRYHLKVIYDAAHAFGETKNGIGIAAFGDVSCFSFHATKVFNTIEGGAACFHDPVLEGKFAALKNFGLSSPETICEIGTNAKMNEFSAAMGLCNLRHLEEAMAKRAAADRLYREQLNAVSGIIVPEVSPLVKRNFAYFPILAKDRERLLAALAQNGIYARKYFYPLTSDFPCYDGRFDSSKTPVSKRISEEVITLPLYEDITAEDIRRICKVIKENADC